jgi:6-pyruvoyltetrahydropterin/6-carboxytetrahydropterin synthase
MPFIAIMRSFEFDAGHRLVEHEGKCKFLHGHHYKAEVSMLPRDGKLDDLGRVIDFGVVKEIIGHWLDTYWDHNMILHHNDELILEAMKQPIESVEHYYKRIIGRNPYVMGKNPTAENMAAELYRTTNVLMPEGICIIEVKLWETPKCYAVYQPLAKE